MTLCRGLKLEEIDSTGVQTRGLVSMFKYTTYLPFLAPKYDTTKQNSGINWSQLLLIFGASGRYIKTFYINRFDPKFTPCFFFNLLAFV